MGRLGTRLQIWLFSVSLATGLLGLFAFGIGVAAAFRNAGNWADAFAGLGAYAILITPVLALSSCVYSVLNITKYRLFNIWLPMSFALLVVSGFGLYNISYIWLD